MEHDFEKKECSLTASEAIIMKAIWEEGGDISISDLIEVLNVNYDKEYARTTITTFLIKLSDKGYVRNYRKGRYAFVYALKSEEEYRTKVLNENAEFWFQGNLSKLLSALCRTRKVSDEELEEMRKVLNESTNADNDH